MITDREIYEARIHSLEQQVEQAQSYARECSDRAAMLEIEPCFDSLNEFQSFVGHWGCVTFPNATMESIAHHAQDEVIELRKALLFAPIDPVSQNDADMDAADVFLLLLHYFHRRGVSLMDTAQAKMEINRARRWGTPDERGVVRHIETAEGA